MKNFQPMNDRVFVKRVEVSNKTKGGIIIPDSAKEKPIEGEVIAVGPGSLQDDGSRRPIHLKVGDRILFGKWSGTEFKFDDEEYVVLKEDDILGILN